MKVRKGPRSTTKYNPYYIELSNTYSLLAEFSYNSSQIHQTTSTERNFKLNASVRRQEKINNHINTYIIEARDNDAATINTVIKLADDERNVMNKPTIHQRSHIGKAFSTATHQRNNRITCDDKHVQLKRKPSIAMHQQKDKTPTLMYDLGTDGNYLNEKDRTKLGPPILRILDKKVGVYNVGV